MPLSGQRSSAGKRLPLKSFVALDPSDKAAHFRRHSKRCIPWLCARPNPIHSHTVKFPHKTLPWLFSLVGLASLSAADRPNVIVLLLDDVGKGWIPPYADHLSADDIEPEIYARYVQVHGHQGAVDKQKHIEAAQACMPTLSRLASEGTVFNQAYATAALCSPSRAGLLTGSFQQDWGAYWNKDVDDFGIPPERTVIAEPLARAGYRTGVVGKWHVAPHDPAYIEKIWVEDLGQELPVARYYNGLWPEIDKRLRDTAWRSSSQPGFHPLDRGFDYYYGYNSHDDVDYGSATLWENHELVPKRPEGEFLTDLFNEKACAFIRDSLQAGDPFFLYYAPKTLHGPISAPPGHYTEQFSSGNQFTDEYAGHLLALDHGIEMMLAVLAEYGQLDNTLFIFTADNGCTLYYVPPYNAPNRGGKGTGWNGGLNVPLIVWQPGLTTGGESDELVSLADLMPTVLDAAGADIPGDIDGRTLLPYLRGQAARGPRESLGSSGIHSSRWSYSYEADGENNKQDATEAPLYAWLIDGDYQLMLVAPIKPGLYQKLPDGYAAQTLLYDIKSDPRQLQNLAEEHPDRVQAMSAGIHQWLSARQEPLTSQQADYEAMLKRTGTDTPK
nr:sulfatase-like hydrolase/transferase [Ruficoccus amylovorans]